MAVLRAVRKYDRALDAREGFASGHKFRMFDIRRGVDILVRIHEFALNEIIEIYWRDEEHPRHHIDVTVCSPRDFE